MYIASLLRECDIISYIYSDFYEFHEACTISHVRCDADVLQ